MSIIQKFVQVFVIAIAFAFSGYSQIDSKVDSTVLKSAIEMGSISTEIQTTNLILNGHFEDDFDKKRLMEIDSTFSIKEEVVKSDYKKIQNGDLNAISKASLDALKSTWSLSQKDVENSAKIIRDLFKETNTDLEIIREQRLKWESTIVVLNSVDTPVEMINGIEEINEKIILVEARLNENLSKLILLETRVNEINNLIFRVQESIQAALEEHSRDVFKQNSPAIWTLLLMGSDTSVVVDSLKEETANLDSLDESQQRMVHWSGEKIRFSFEFIETNQNTIYFHVILWILTVMLSVRFGRINFTFNEADTLSFAQKSLLDVRERLVLSATYVSILYTAVLYEFLPFLIMEVLVLSLILLNVLIQYRSQGKEIVKIALLLVLLFVTGQLSTESWLNPLMHRFYLFGKIGLIYWVLLLFKEYLISYKNDTSPTIWRKLPQTVGLIKILLSVSVLANILGFVKMSSIIMLLVTQILVVSFIFYGILVTSNGLISLIFNVSWTPKKPSSLDFRNSMEGIALNVVNFFASLFWVKAILSTVGIYDPIKNAILGVFSSPIEIGTVSISLEDITYSVIVFVLTYALTKFIGILISEGGLDRFKLKRGVPNAISLVVRYSLFGLGFMLALSVAGIDLTSFSLMAGALGIGIGFGLQNIISNFVSGLILVFERPLQEGDVVEVNSLLGIVKNIGVRSSNIRTYTGSEVVVPNEALISKELINWTLSDPNKRIEITIGVDYGSEPRQIIQLLIDAALSHNDVQKDPAPRAFFEEFGDSSLDFRLLFWVHHSIALGVRSEVMLKVSDIMKEHHINIPFPIRTIMTNESLKKNKISAELLPDKRRNEDFNADNSEGTKN